MQQNVKVKMDVVKRIKELLRRLALAKGLWVGHYDGGDDLQKYFAEGNCHRPLSF